MKILIAGDFRWHNGSSQVINEYVKCGPTLGIEFALAAELGSHDSHVVKYLPFCDDLKWASHLLVVYETRPFLSEQDIWKICQVFPRSRRAIIDADARWAPETVVGEDSNTWPCGQQQWKENMKAISDLILQPTIGPPHDGAVRFSYHGMPASSNGSKLLARTQYQSDFQYVGSNWFRFASAVDSFAAARDAFGAHGRLALKGTFWDGSQCLGFEDATRSDPSVLRRLGVCVGGPVPFGKVVNEMSQALVSPVLVRPVLTDLGLITPRMFETAASSTIPVYRLEEKNIAGLYQDSSALCMGDDPRTFLSKIVDNPIPYQLIANEIRLSLFEEYSYNKVIQNLRSLLEQN